MRFAPRTKRPKKGRSRKNVTGKYKAPHSQAEEPFGEEAMTPEEKIIRAEEITHRYNAWMANYRILHFNNYTLMVNSSSTETDGHVTRMLHAMNIPMRNLEDNVLFMVRHIWTTATEKLKDTIGAELKPLLNISRLLFLLRDAQTRNTDLIAAINSVKTNVIKGIANKEVCCILTCTQGRHHGMNSRPYCQDHFGLALFNGLRHDCRACHVWSLLALKLDISGGHVHNSIQTLDVPLIDKTTHMRLNVRLRRFCGPLKKGEVWGSLRFHRGVFHWTRKCTLAITAPITNLPRTPTRRGKVDWCRTIPSVIKTNTAAQRRG